eukprot:3660651-Amphidinium_carterae.1
MAFTPTQVLQHQMQKGKLEQELKKVETAFPDVELSAFLWSTISNANPQTKDRLLKYRAIIKHAVIDMFLLSLGRLPNGIVQHAQLLWLGLAAEKSTSALCAHHAV